MRADRGERLRERLRAVVLASLLAGPQPDRGGVLEGEGAVAAGRGARTRKALMEAMGRALDVVSTKDSREFFEHCGYPLPAQPL